MHNNRGVDKSRVCHLIGGVRAQRAGITHAPKAAARGSDKQAPAEAL